MEACLNSVTSRNSLEQRFHRCEQNFHTPSRQHHACAVRRVRRRPPGHLKVVHYGLGVHVVGWVSRSADLQVSPLT
eukprot:2387932-Prymnesium_polylepis.2